MSPPHSVAAGFRSQTPRSSLSSAGARASRLTGRRCGLLERDRAPDPARPRVRGGFRGRKVLASTRRAFMNARMGRVDFQADKADDVVSHVRENIVPRYEETEGVKGFTLLLDRARGEGIGI